MKRILIVFFLLTIVAGVFAESPFRRHKFGQFKVLPKTDSALVFYGNSITNMFEWREALGGDPRILNRGVSGAVTEELIEHAPDIASLHPAKIFIGIGTNDLGNEELCNPDSVASRIERLVAIFRQESPDTKVFIQSILPSEYGLRSLDAIERTNALVKEKTEALGGRYINLYDDMHGIVAKEISYDGLHLTADGYALWLEKIAPLTGYQPIISVGTPMNNGGINTNSFGMRNTYFSVLPIHSSDIIFMGDELIHGGEWQELLAEPRAKSRGTGWGYGGLKLKDWINSTEAIFAANGNKEAPSQIFVYAGSEELYREGTDMDTLLSNYHELITSIRKYAPAESTNIVLLSLIPRNENHLNEALTIPFNNRLALLAKDLPSTQYLDIYSPLSSDNNSANPKYVDENFLTGEGYLKLANLIKGEIR